MTEAATARSCRCGGAQAVFKGSAERSNHIEGFETQHFLSAQTSVSSAATKKGHSRLLLRHREDQKVLPGVSCPRLRDERQHGQGDVDPMPSVRFTALWAR